jgi:putative endonuclease
LGAKNKLHLQSFTAKYNINQLVYFERFATIPAASAREKELKGWLRYRKIALIVSTNPDWRDLSTDWGKPIQLPPSS